MKADISAVRRRKGLNSRNIIAGLQDGRATLYGRRGLQPGPTGGLFNVSEQAQRIAGWAPTCIFVLGILIPLEIGRCSLSSHQSAFILKLS